jgi:hypothetical protein
MLNNKLLLQTALELICLNYFHLRNYFCMHFICVLSSPKLLVFHAVFSDLYLNLNKNFPVITFACTIYYFSARWSCIVGSHSICSHYFELRYMSKYSLIWYKILRRPVLSRLKSGLCIQTPADISMRSTANKQPHELSEGESDWAVYSAHYGKGRHQTEGGSGRKGILLYIF